MEPITPLDWSRMFLGNEPTLYYLEIVLRVVIIYFYAVLLVRLMGKRGRKQLSPFEYVVIIALGSAMGDVLFYPEVPILYAFLVIALIVALSQGIAFLQWKFLFLQRWFDGTATVVIRNGVVNPRALEKEKLAPVELYSMLRNSGVCNIEEVAIASLELDGTLSVFTKKQMAEGKDSVLLKELK